MFAMDGLLETFATVVKEMQVFPGAVAAESERVAPFLATTTVLMEAVKRGAGREAAHAAIQAHAIDFAEEIRTGRAEPGGLLRRLAEDPRIGLSEGELTRLLALDPRFAGAALEQVDAFVNEVNALVARVPEAAKYEAAEIL
jgi:adenylosuccinate lyase